MSQNDKVLNEIIRRFREDDEKDRKSKGLSKVRSDFEALQYRRQFDDFYSDVTNALSAAIKTNFGRLLDTSLASIFINDIHLTKYHAYLDDYLVLPYALAKLLDYQTNSRGKITDIAKICNLFALANMLGSLKQGTTMDETKYEFVRAFQSLVVGLKNLNIQNAPFSEGGTQIGNFLYWIIYDSSSGELNLNILIDLAEATKGSFGDFKTFLTAYWRIRKASPDTSVKFFYNEILPNIK